MTARLGLALASEKAKGNHVSSREAPVFLKTWGTSRFPTPLPAHRSKGDR
jgi:hypothetical protein